MLKELPLVLLKDNIKKLLIVIIFTLTLLFVSGCKSEYEVSIDNNIKSNIIDDNYRTFYQVFVGSFSDSNKDGIGDLKGLVNRLDYLNDGKPNSGKSLGVTGLWLSPIMSSPSYHKYDVTNYYEIDPSFGTMEDFKKLLKEAHKRGIKVIIDLVINHTSEWHPWFRELKKAYQNDTDSKYKDYYVVVEEENQDPYKKYYPLYRESNYYYEGNFSSSMPELNFDNEDVKEEIKDIINYWLGLGVDGFRLDAAKYIYLDEEEKNISFWSWFMEEAKKIKEDVYVVGEVWSSGNGILPYYENFNNFDFEMAENYGLIARAAKASISVTDYLESIKTYQDKVLNMNDEAILSPFISNHDMDRSAGYLSVDDYIMQMAASLYLLLPGNPFIYYGEELGMKGSRGNANTDANRRLAMLWGDKDKVKDPVGTTYKKSLQINKTVKEQLKDKDSLVNHYKKLIMIRNAFPEIARGSFTTLKIYDIITLGGYVSTYKGESVVVIHNTGVKSQTIDLTLYLDQLPLKLITAVGKGKGKLTGNKVTIDGLTTIILK